MLPKATLKKSALHERVKIAAKKRPAAVTLNIRDSSLRSMVLRPLSFQGLIFAWFAHFCKITNEVSQGTDDVIIHKNNLTEFKIFLILYRLPLLQNDNFSKCVIWNTG